MSKDPSQAREWLKRRRDTTEHPDPLKLAVFVSTINGVVLYAALRLQGLDIALSAGVAVVAFVVLTPVLEGYYRGRG